ncbi:MAG: hypothetical protein HZB79_00390 [Deltaproteobacteria bacterium]|nr:hypothetical protein [Deltaproteobacteria bacterium]
MIKRITALTIFLLIIIGGIFLFYKPSEKVPADNPVPASFKQGEIASIPEKNAGTYEPENPANIDKLKSDVIQKEISEKISESFASQKTQDEKPLNPEASPAVQQRKPSFDIADDHVSKNFQQNDGSHFTVKIEGSENAVVGQIIMILLEEAYIKIGGDLGYYPEDKITAVLYSKEQFSDVTKSPSWVSALYDGRIKLPVGGITQRTNLLEKVLFHEYTHAIVHRLSKGRAPTWLNEGIAQYEDGTRGSEYAEILASIADNKISVSLMAIEGSFMGLNAASVQVAYIASISAAEYIINEFGISAVRNIFERIGNGEPLSSAVSNSLHMSYADLQASWLRNLKNRYR